jgi:hypothetical protein
MNQNRFDALTRSLTGIPSRRHLLHGLASVGFGLGLEMASLSRIAEAKKKRKRKKKGKKAKPNAFGCLNIGQPCNGASGACCSGICEGSKPKKGKPDRSRCVAHNELGCDADDSTCSETVPCGVDGICYQTTGRAGFCANGGLCDCAPCTKYTDCEGQFGPGAACIVCTGECAGVNGSQGTACVPAAT